MSTDNSHSSGCLPSVASQATKGQMNLQNKAQSEPQVRYTEEKTIIKTAMKPRVEKDDHHFLTREKVCRPAETSFWAPPTEPSHSYQNEATLLTPFWARLTEHSHSYQNEASRLTLVSLWLGQSRQWSTP